MNNYGKKTISKLFINALKNNKLILKDEEEKTKMTSNLEKFPLKTTKYLIREYNINFKDLESMSDDLFSKYETFVVIGCELSKDLDVVCVVDSKYQSDGLTYPLLSSEKERLIEELKKIGYDEEKIRLIDLNIVTIENKNISSLTKGGRETQNIILETYKYHKQLYECPELEFIKINLIEKLKPISKFFVDYLENITNDYENIRNQKILSYCSSDKLFEFSKRIRNKILCKNTENKKEWYDTMKSLTMKISQLVLLKYGLYSYRKLEIYEKISKLSEFEGFDKENILWLLTRGEFGEENPELILRLYDIYCNILNEYEKSITKKIFEIKFNELYFSDFYSQFNEFFKSPNEATELFEKEFINNFNDLSVNSAFISKSSNENKRYILLDIFESKYHENFIWINQRSKEWLELLKFYTCGKNSKVISNTFEAKFNLIRGAIAERIITDYFNINNLDCIDNINNFKKIELGLIVESTEKSSFGCAPDLLLVKNTDDEKEIIPVEIKCLKSDKKNSSYYGSFDLADKQCNSVKYILNNFKTDIVKRKIIIITWFLDDRLIYEVNLVSN